MAWVGFPPIPAQAGVSMECGLYSDCGLRNAELGWTQAFP